VQRPGPGTPDGGERDPRLDGVRGIAILLVLLCHLTQFGGIAPDGPWPDRAWRALTLPLGFGVDLFFVLSGFLITGILLETRESPGYFRIFYARRFLRIFPLYYGALAAAFLVLPLVPELAVSLEPVRRDAFWYWTYLTNYRFAEVGWPRVPYLGHFWTLAVEEQFYLVWPAVVRFLPRRLLPWLCVTAIVLGTWGRVHSWNLDEPASATLATHLRLDGLAIGALLAWLAREPGGLSRWRRIAAWAGAAAAVVAIVLIARGGTDGPELAGRAFLQVFQALAFGAFLVLAMTAPRGAALPRVLSSGWLTRLGLYSYSLYVVHAPILVWLGRHDYNAKLLPAVLGSRLPAALVHAAVAGGACVLLAALSYHQFESRFLALKRHVRYAAPRRRESPREERARAV
jgi:peptidoglycan/LPS O-acetylase OafA/YrhL